MGEVDVSLEASGGGISGAVAVGYAGRYDGVSINARVLGSNQLVEYVSYNGRPAEGRVTRLFVPADEMPGGRVEFEARAGPASAGGVRVRASVIEQHKEIESGSATLRRGP